MPDSPTTISSKLHSQRSAASEYTPCAALLRPLIVTRPTSLDVQFVDFDGVRFHLSTPERKTQLLLSMSIKCWDELVKYGVNSVLQREYGSKVKPQPESEYNVSLELDLEQFPPEGGAFVIPCHAHIALRVIRGTRRPNQVHLAA